ncbi:MAG: DUF4474 domain-containing protein [Clostridia bacterium]|nr:DUF4474 domain-containing protein [Clostridia bacterium]
MRCTKKAIAVLLVLLTLSAWAAVFAAALPQDALPVEAMQTPLLHDETATPPENKDSLAPAADNNGKLRGETQDTEEQNPADPTPASQPETPAKQDPISVSLTASNVEVTVRRTIQMTAETKGFTQTPTLTWTSSDESIATVDQNGQVKGVKAGKATITVTAKSGDTTAQDSMVIFVIKLKTPIKLLLQEYQVLGYKYHFRDDYYYVNDVQCWQRGFGFGRFYDLVAPYILLEYDYVRVFFTYQDKDYMVQLWKGQYGLVFYGCEQGIYCKEHSDKQDSVFTFYKSMEQNEWPEMELTLYHDKQGNGNYVREFTRDRGTHWWCSGFKPGHLRKEEPATELRQEGSIFFKDAEMARLFADGLKVCGFGEAKDAESMELDEYNLNGSTVSFRWQNINDAETTMPIKIAGGTAFAVGGLAFIVGLLLLLAIIAMMGMGIMLFIIIL